MPEDLRQIAAAHGVATSYRNERRVPVEVDADVVVEVLSLLDVDASTEVARRAELARLDELDRAGILAPTVAVRLTGDAVPFPGAVELVGETGSRLDVSDELPEDLTYERWAAIGQTFQQLERSVGFWLGDWWNNGERKWGELSAQAIKEMTGHERSTI